MKKFLGVLLDIVVTILVVVAVCMTVVSLSTAEDGITHVAGYIPLNIQTESMEPYIMAHDLIFDKPVEEADIKVNDVITFKAEEQGTIILKTHRVTKVNNEDGNISFITKGDNNDVEDAEPVYYNNVVGLYTGKKISKIGAALNFLQSQIGFLICIVLPLFILFVYQLYKFIVTIIEEKNNAFKEKNEKANDKKEEVIEDKKEEKTEVKPEEKEETHEEKTEVDSLDDFAKQADDMKKEYLDSIDAKKAEDKEKEEIKDAEEVKEEEKSETEVIDDEDEVI